MRILIFGNGFLGNRFAAAWPDAVLTDARIDDADAVRRAIAEHRPEAVLNAAGKTGTPNVDWCEEHPHETHRSNTVGALVLAEACAAAGVYLLHLGSGCVFYGPSPSPGGWTEDDYANPEAFYSRSKYSADLILARLPNVGVARLRMPVDHMPSARNLIDKLTSYRQIIDVENSVTVVDDLVEACRKLLLRRGEGVFHVVNPGIMRHRDLIELYRQIVDPTFACEWIRAEDLVARGLAIRGRSNVILQSRRLAELGITMRPIQEALLDTMGKYAAAKRAAVARANAPASFTGKGEGTIKGVILAGGLGTRLAPLTNITNKHLLPVYDKPMVLYPLLTLLRAGIRKILVITGPEHAQHFVKLFGSGSAHACDITYRVQDTPGGIAHALALAEDFVGSDRSAVILGDNIFEDDLSAEIGSFTGGAMAFYTPVERPNAYGVVEVDEATGQVLSIEEKPDHPKSNYAQVGLYLYDHTVWDAIRTLTPSGRGELEVTDLNNHYLRRGALVARKVRGRWWDAGTFAGMAEAARHFMRKKEGG